MDKKIGLNTKEQMNFPPIYMAAQLLFLHLLVKKIPKLAI